MKRFLTAASLLLLALGAAQAQVLPAKWCSDVKIRFFAGGAEAYRSKKPALCFSPLAPSGSTEILTPRRQTCCVSAF